MRDIRRKENIPARDPGGFQGRLVVPRVYPPAPSRTPILQPTVPQPNRVYRRLALLGGCLGFCFLGVFAVIQIIPALGESAVVEMKAALESLRAGEREKAQTHLALARRDFATGARWLRPFAWFPTGGTQVPGIAQGIAAEALFRAGREGVDSATVLLPVLPDFLDRSPVSNGPVSAIDRLQRSGVAVTAAYDHLIVAQRALERVRVDALPEQYRARVTQVRTALPLTTALLRGYTEHQTLLAELLGMNGPRNYLFLFQNNHELRATGGFIGSYALLEMNQARIRRFFVDGIFNPDGQLKENIVPPKPIQKISAGWSLHDSNWFPDFPTSAEKAIFFYEKTGGPTVDGIITLTPEVLERILTLVGPVSLPEYGVTIEAENFMPILQEEVEVKYDREENNPKKILGDLTEVLIRRFLSFDHPQETWKLGGLLAELLNEKHILLYARHPDIEQLIRGVGWSGEVIETPRDYLSVIHTNINGYKTDGVIRESISHTAEIQSDGRVRDTVSITREHTGGNTPYDWWNKVNADYLRVYVPQGATLISAEGMTREFPEPPLNYAALGFRQDPDITREEGEMVIDPASGTRISTDAGKTVFGNWVYVSPGESVTVRYVYELPFRMTLGTADEKEAVHSYSALYQKQSGTQGVRLKATLHYPEGWQPVWQTPENLIPYQRIFTLEQPLERDVYWGVVFGKKN